jgi:hypothetical protein
VYIRQGTYRIIVMKGLDVKEFVNKAVENELERMDIEKE